MKASFHTSLDRSLIKKRIEFNFSKVSLKLDLSESLFSSFDVDVGTKALLNSLRKDNAIDYSKVLDLGSGYGPIGLFLKAQDPSRNVHMVDRDALAVAFSSHNASLNDLDVQVYPSLDYEQVKGKFSLIAANFPAKLATKGLRTFVYGASERLIKNGVLAIVVVRELGRRLERILKKRAIRTIYREDKKGHSIFHVSFTTPIRPPTQKYRRHEMTLMLSKKCKVETAFGLAEFDTLSYGTRALFTLLRKMKHHRSVLVLEPGQGHGAIAVMDQLKPREIVLASRDLLSLRFSARNVKNSFGVEPSQKHIPYLQKTPKQELTVWNIQRKEDFLVNARNLKVLVEARRPFLLCGEELLLRRLLTRVTATVVQEVARKNYRAQLVKPDNT